ncbi:MAG: iron donor protein CyaY [Alphaproteobacteria bacterium]|nr:iron donor protein CyaY [Alphaproteobacteria bacterium]
MNEAQYLETVAELFSLLTDRVELADHEQLFDVDCVPGIVTITAPSGKQFVINQHLPTKQIWVSSPISGAGHFAFDSSKSIWVNSSGHELCEVLKSDLLSYGLTIS